MVQVEKLIEALEARYKLNIKDFLQLYQNNKSRDDICEILGVNSWAVRAVANALNLRMGKRHRAHDYALYLSRYSEKAEDKLIVELAEANEDLEALSKELVAKEKSVAKARREINKYRSALQKENTFDSIKEIITSAVRNIPPLEPIDIVTSTTNTYAKHTQVIVLSDLHFEEVVSTQDVGSNSYNWDIASQRLDKVFSESMNAYRGEESLIVACLGDMISGIIHDSLESTSKPTGQAVAELAAILANYIRSVSSLYSSVYVPCVHGNHGRISENKKSNASGFNFEYLMYNIMKSLLSDCKNVVVDISTTGLLTCFVGSEHKTIGFHHGDFFKFVGDIKFLRVKEAFRQATGNEPDIIIQGHTHCFLVEEMPRGGKYITNGSLIGVNGYSHTNGMLGKSWGQVIMSLLPSGDVENVRLVQ